MKDEYSYNPKPVKEDKSEHIVRNREITRECLETNKDGPGPGLRKRHNTIAKVLQGLHPARKIQGKSVLDLGCREGFLLDVLKGIGLTDFYGIDISEQAIKRLKERGYDGEVMNIEDMALSCHELYKDIIIASHVLEHCVNQKKVVNDLATIAKTGALVYVVVPYEKNLNPKEKYGHWTPFTSSEMLSDLFSHHIWTHYYFRYYKQQNDFHAVYRRR